MNHEDDESTRRLLSLALEYRGRPIDDLVDRLSAGDGDEWLTRTLRTPTPHGGLPEGLLEGHWTLPQMLQIKEYFKRGADPRNAESRRKSLLGYFLCTAAAQVHHHRLLSSGPREELAEAWRELAALASPPWRALLIEASRQLESRKPPASKSKSELPVLQRSPPPCVP